MNNIWEVEINADDCPVQMWNSNLTIDMKADYVNNDLWELLTGQSQHRIHKLSVGDEIYIAHTDITYKLGDKYGDSSLVQVSYGCGMFVLSIFFTTLWLCL